MEIYENDINNDCGMDCGMDCGVLGGASDRDGTCNGDGCNPHERMMN